MEFLAFIAQGFMYLLIVGGIAFLGFCLGGSLASAAGAKRKVCFWVASVAAVVFPAACYVLGRVIAGG